MHSVTFCKIFHRMRIKSIIVINGYYYREKNSLKKRKLRLKMPPLTRRDRKDDVKALASNMYSGGTDETQFKARDAIV